MQYQNILCPLDGGELMQEGQDTAAYISQISGANLILLHVVDKWYRSMHLATDSNEWKAIHENWLNDGKALLETEARKLLDAGVKDLETILRDGEVAYEIVAVAKEKRADLIVMATHHYSPLGKFFSGSVTDRVTRKSPCPVLWVFNTPKHPDIRFNPERWSGRGDVEVPPDR